MSERSGVATMVLAASAALVALVGINHVSRRTIQIEENESEQKSPTTTSPQNVLDVVQKRRSIFPKQYSGKPVQKSTIDQMLEAARWAPSHHLTEPWEFVVLESLEAREEFGEFLAESYKESCLASSKPFNQAKFDKKQKNATKASHIIAIILHDKSQRNPLVEEVASVSMAVQNMFLVATAYGIGAYWSSGGIYDKSSGEASLLHNPPRLKKFLGWDESEDKRMCLGWVFVGDYFGDKDVVSKSWPTGRRKEYTENNLSWR